MRSPPPAAAALLLAALAALPYRGTEADVTSTLLNADSKRKLNYSTLNKTYQRLHAAYSDLAGARSAPRGPNATSDFGNSEININKIRSGGRTGLKFPKDRGRGLSYEIRVNNAREEARGGSDFSKVSPERNHKRRKRDEGNARGERGDRDASDSRATPWEASRAPVSPTMPAVVRMSSVEIISSKTVIKSGGSSLGEAGSNISVAKPQLEVGTRPSESILSSLVLKEVPLEVRSNSSDVESSSPKTEVWAALAEALSASSPGPFPSAAAGGGTLRPLPVPSNGTRAQDRRRKAGEAGSGAPLLNYIFDTYSSTHQHRNDRAGGGGRMTAAEPAVEALVGSTAHLDCKVDALHDKLVSWVRRKSDGDAMELLTTGTQKYTADDRYSARFMAPDTWRLEIREVRAGDAALYDCQLSAHPPRTARVALHVPAVSVVIVDGAGASVSEQVCEQGSTVTLRCVVRGLRMEGGRALHWYRRDALLNDDTTRGGISVRTELGATGAESVLRVARVGPADAGRYTCLVHAAPRAALLAPAHVALHVIQGESLAELHAGRGTALRATILFIFICTFHLYLYY